MGLPAIVCKGCGDMGFPVDSCTACTRTGVGGGTVSYCVTCHRLKVPYGQRCPWCRERTATTDTLEPEEARARESRPCGGCGKQAPLVALYCRCFKLLAGTPKWWLSVILALSPVVLCVGLSFWNSALLLYGGLSAGVLAYLAFSLRELPNVRAVALAWIVPWLLVFGLLDAVSDRRGELLNLAALGYLAVFLVLLCRRSAFWLRVEKDPAEVLIAVILLSVTVYFLIFDLFAWLGLIPRGSGQLLWIGYQRLGPYYWAIRFTLILSFVAALLIAAAHSVSKQSLGPVAPGTDPLDKLAMYAALFWREFWKMAKRAILAAYRLQASFLSTSLLPWLLSFFAAMGIRNASQSLYHYLAASPGAGAGSVLWEALIAGAAVSGFEYLCYASVFSTLDAPFARVARTFPRFASATLIDAVMLLFHLSYVIPISVAVLFVLAHFWKLRVLNPGPGPYFWLALVLLPAVWFRARRRRVFGRDASR
jgi:hypothetical protein